MLIHILFQFLAGLEDHPVAGGDGEGFSAYGIASGMFSRKAVEEGAKTSKLHPLLLCNLLI